MVKPFDYWIIYSSTFNFPYIVFTVNFIFRILNFPYILFPMHFIFIAFKFLYILFPQCIPSKYFQISILKLPPKNFLIFSEFFISNIYLSHREWKCPYCVRLMMCQQYILLIAQHRHLDAHPFDVVLFGGRKPWYIVKAPFEDVWFFEGDLRNISR